MDQNNQQPTPPVRRRYHAQTVDTQFRSAQTNNSFTVGNAPSQNMQAPVRTRAKRYSPDHANDKPPEQKTAVFPQNAPLAEPSFIASGSWPFPSTQPPKNTASSQSNFQQPQNIPSQKVQSPPQMFVPAQNQPNAPHQRFTPSANPSPERWQNVPEHSPIPNHNKQSDTPVSPIRPIKPPPQKAQPIDYPPEFKWKDKAAPSDEPSKEETAAPKTQKRNLKRIVYRFGVFLCTAVLITSSAMLIKYFSQIHKANQASNHLREIYRDEDASASVAETTSAPAVAPEATPTVSQAVTATATPRPVPANASADFLAMWPSKYPGNEELRIQERFTPLRQQNRDVVGWLTIDGVLDEPVFQRDNSYYLTHDATGTSNPTGALFIDENCNLRTVPMQVLIHGHNMKEGAMFGSLKKYKVKDASFYREHPFIQFDTLYENSTYVIFAVAEVNIVSGNTHYFPFWHQFHFTDLDSFQKYVSLAKEYSRFKVDIDVQPGDRLLTLATCSSGDDNLRLIVMARRLRENEDTIMLSNQILSATAQ